LTKYILTKIPKGDQTLAMHTYYEYPKLYWFQLLPTLIGVETGPNLGEQVLNMCKKVTFLLHVLRASRWHAHFQFGHASH